MKPAGVVLAAFSLAGIAACGGTSVNGPGGTGGTLTNDPTGGDIATYEKLASNTQSAAWTYRTTMVGPGQTLRAAEAEACVASRLGKARQGPDAPREDLLPPRGRLGVCAQSPASVPS
jgi:hypothetical protein